LSYKKCESYNFEGMGNIKSIVFVPSDFYWEILKELKIIKILSEFENFILDIIDALFK